MSTAPNATTQAAPNAHQSYLAKIESFFKKVGAEVLKVETAIFGADATVKLNAAFKAAIEDPLGQLAIEAVTAAADLEKGTISFSAASAGLVSSAKAAGKNVEGSLVTTLIAAAQAALESK